MLCEHLKELQDFVKDNQLKIGGLDMIRLVCNKCNVQHECPEVSSEYWQPAALKDEDEKKQTD